MFPTSMADWKTSEEHEEIRELKANNIALKGSLDDTEKSFDHVKLCLDRSESQVQRLSTFAAHSEIAGYFQCFFFFRKPRNVKIRDLPTLRCLDKLSLVL